MESLNSEGIRRLLAAVNERPWYPMAFLALLPGFIQPPCLRCVVELWARPWRVFRSAELSIGYARVIPLSYHKAGEEPSYGGAAGLVADRLREHRETDPAR